MKVEGQSKFVIPAERFGVSASESGYTLQYSVDGENFSDYDTPCPSNEPLLVINTVNGLTYKLKDNTDTVYVQY